jgi:hypothetical protein
LTTQEQLCQPILCGFTSEVNMNTMLAALRRLHSNVSDTYFYLRLSLGVAAILLPLVLWLGGKWTLGIPPMTSISAYYHTEQRDILVGVLFAVGFTLFIYKGFSFAEDWLLNVAGLSIIGVAYFPMKASDVLKCFRPCEGPCVDYSDVLDRTPDALIASGFHGPSAVIFFIAIGLVCGFCAHRTLHLIPDTAIRKTYLWTYRVMGLAMVALPLATALIIRMSPVAGSDCQDRTIFWIEATGVWVFAAFWLLKTYEGHKYGADKTYLDRRAIPPERASAA